MVTSWPPTTGNAASLDTRSVAKESLDVCVEFTLKY